MATIAQQANHIFKNLDEPSQMAGLKFLQFLANGFDTTRTKKQQENAKYLAKLEESIAQANRGEVVKYTIDELNALINGS